MTTLRRTMLPLGLAGLLAVTPLHAAVAACAEFLTSSFHDEPAAAVLIGTEEVVRTVGGGSQPRVTERVTVGYYRFHDGSTVGLDCDTYDRA